MEKQLATTTKQNKNNRTKEQTKTENVQSDTFTRENNVKQQRIKYFAVLFRYVAIIFIDTIALFVVSIDSTAVTILSLFKQKQHIQLQDVAANEILLNRYVHWTQNQMILFSFDILLFDMCWLQLYPL